LAATSSLEDVSADDVAIVNTESGNAIVVT
jgi:hypothetical protein